MRFLVKKDYKPHNFKEGDVILINEVAWPDFIEELKKQEIIEETNSGDIL